MVDVDRRTFLKRSAAAAGGLALAGPLQALLADQVSADGRGHGHPGRGYGPLSPKRDNSTGATMLALPAGFEYWSFGALGSIMSDGRPTPPAHDGMAAFTHGRRKIRLVRNQEVRGAGPAFGPVDRAYDPGAPGGTVTVIFDPDDPEDVEDFASISGTSTNCAGGRTPWGSWLTCEETVTPLAGVPHGYVFDVPASADEAVDAVPLRAMGRFVHEAVAVDPSTSIVYETEDAGDDSGFYRFTPRRRGNLSQGKLQMLAVDDRPQYDTRTGQRVGKKLRTTWVDVDEPDPDLAGGAPSVFAQGFAEGGARFRRLEGAWWSSEDDAVYFTSTDGGDAASGQVWGFRPDRRGGTLTLLYESPSSDVLLKPDNLTVSPRGGILLCEDTDRARQTFLRGLTERGQIYPFAANIREGLIPGTTTPASWDEFAGATFSKDGEWLFVNIQTPGVTFAITGPWRRGDL